MPNTIQHDMAAIPKEQWYHHQTGRIPQVTILAGWPQVVGAVHPLHIEFNLFTRPDKQLLHATDL